MIIAKYIQFTTNHPSLNSMLIILLINICLTNVHFIDFKDQVLSTKLFLWCARPTVFKTNGPLEQRPSRLTFRYINGQL